MLYLKKENKLMFISNNCLRVLRLSLPQIKLQYVGAFLLLQGKNTSQILLW